MTGEDDWIARAGARFREHERKRDIVERLEGFLLPATPAPALALALKDAITKIEALRLARDAQDRCHWDMIAENRLLAEEIERLEERLGSLTCTKNVSLGRTFMTDSNERDTMKDAVATMGDLLPPDVAGRDAVHVAVISAVAGHILAPGQRVAITQDAGPDVRAVARSALNTPPGDEPVGIVDPFLKAAVPSGARFWLFLMPRTITSLRHVWTHPAFEDQPSAYAPPSAQLASEKWLRDYADKLDLSYNRLMGGARAWIQYGEYLNDGPTLEGISTDPEFWRHYEAVTGAVVPADKREHFFTCSC